MNMLLPNPFGAYAQGMQTGEQAMDARQQRADRNLLREIGPGLMNGDPAAMEQFARIDPMGAMQIQGQRENREYQRGRDAKVDARANEQLALSRAAGERAKQQLAMQMDAQTFERELMETDRAVAALMTAQTPEQWDQIAQQYGAEDYAGQFENRDAIAAYAEGLTGTLNRMAPSKPADEYGRYVQEEIAAGREPMSRIDYKRAGRTTTQTRVGPDGSVEIVEGFGTDPLAGVKFTEGQGKDNVYSTRARGALQTLEPVADALANRGDRVAEGLGGVTLGLSRQGQSEDFQVANQAGLEFLQAILRKDTGAAITEAEVNSYGKTYLPEPGDKPAVLEAKRQARIRAVNALESGMSAEQMLARDRALLRTAKETGQAGDNNTVSGMPPDFAQQYGKAAEDAGLTVEELWEAWPNK